MEYIIETENLVKQYKSKFAVNNVSIHVKKGDIYGLIGRNGAGKTTLMKLILGLANPTKGKIKLFDSEKNDKSRKRIGSLIEAPGLYNNCTAYENMLRFSILYGANKNDIKPILSKVGLSDTGKKKAGSFSLGMRQRLGIAIALLGNPEIMILDEPINGLDPTGIKEIRDVISTLNHDGITFLISSHLLDELSKVATRYGIISDGELREEFTAAQLHERCRKHIKLCTDDNIKALRLLKEQTPDIIAELKADELYISSHLEQTASMNAYLVGHGVGVIQIVLAENDFEEYFISHLGK